MGANNRWMWVILSLLILTAACSQDKKESTPEKEQHAESFHHTPYLISVGKADSLISNDPHIAILDVRKEERYAEGHLPGAIRIYRPDYESDTFPYPGMRPEKEKLERKMSERGIDRNDVILLYDEHGDVDAARLWWILVQFGHPNVRLINGGYTAWIKSGKKISREIPEIATTDFRFPHDFDHSLNISREEVLHILNDTNYILVDCRSTDEYMGKIIKKGALKAGHIPGAIHEDYIYCLKYDGDYTFLPTDQLSELFESKGILKNKKIITYCQSGVRSALSLFALRELLGYPDVRNYDGSWIEWTHFDNSPIETDSLKEI